jgi:hypothetical protein
METKYSEPRPATDENHRDHIALIKLRMAEPLTPKDLAELERFFLEQGIAAPEDLPSRSKKGWATSSGPRPG